MNEEPGSRNLLHKLTRGDLPVILIAAVAQGWSLYGLHWSIDRSVWPSTDTGLLVAFYAVALFVPLTIQMLAPYVRRPLTWMIVAALVAFYLLVGWHYGEWVRDGLARRWPDNWWFGLAFIAAIQWLLVMPFLQARSIDGRWHSRYELLFSSAWSNKLVLAEAVAFTGLFWLLLLLWAQLFKLLGIRFFAELFQEPIFAYPVTSIVFGAALKLIGSLEGLTKVLLEQALSVLKWLALLAGLILALFSVALSFELPDMIASGQRTVAALWLLWMVAVTVLLVNAAYRDGSIENPYPRALGLALRCVIPLTVVVALVAIYALWLRVDQHGLTVPRFWGWVVAGTALLYSVGYAAAVRHRTHWMRSIASVNVFVALYLIAVLSLALTPVLSPHRIAANSQFAKAQEAPSDAAEGFSPQMTYLRFDAGKYGRDRLEELSRIENHPRAADIRREAQAALARQYRWAPPQYDSATLFADLVVHPSGRTLEPQLAELAANDVRAGSSRYIPDVTGMAGIFVDLDGDQTLEFVFLASGPTIVFRNDGGFWRRVGEMSESSAESPGAVVSRVRDGDFKVEPSTWNDLVIGDVRYRLPAAAR